MLQSSEFVLNFQCLFSLLMLTTSNVFDLINYFSQTLWLSVGASVVGMLWLRRVKPEMPRPIKVNIVIPYLFLVAIGCLVVIPAITRPKDTAIGAAILLSGIPVYYLCVKWKSKPQMYHSFSSSVLRFLQKVCSCILVDSSEKMSNWTSIVKRIWISIAFFWFEMFDRRKYIWKKTD